MTGFAALDPLLPDRVRAGGGERLRRRLADGREVEGVLYRLRNDGWASLWQAREVWDLTPLSGDVGEAGMGALLAAVRERLRARPCGPDSACTVTWPSRDVSVAPTLIGHGLVPGIVLAVCEEPTAADVPGEAGVTVRRATEADTGEAVALWLAELRYSALVGPATVRPGAADRLAAEFRRAVRAGEPVWLAEADGVPVGVAVCAWPAPIPHRIADGLWARVGTVSVAPAARGTGIGRTLMATAHRELVRDRARGAYLFYSPHNALSTVFWHRQGYRPLWTVWEVRPATALR